MIVHMQATQQDQDGWEKFVGDTNMISWLRNVCCDLNLWSFIVCHNIAWLHSLESSHCTKKLARNDAEIEYKKFVKIPLLMIDSEVFSD